MALTHPIEGQLSDQLSGLYSWGATMLQLLQLYQES